MFSLNQNYLKFCQNKNSMGGDVFQHSKNCIHDARERGTLSTYPLVSKTSRNMTSRSDGFRCTIEYPGDAAGYHHQQSAFTTSNFRYGSFYYGMQPQPATAYNSSPLKVYGVNTRNMRV